MSEDYAEATGGGSRGRLWDALSAVVALVGLADSVYLTAEKLSGAIVPCVVTSGCETVLTSEYAVLPGGVPLAALGAAAYFAAFSLATLSAFGYAQARTPLLVVVGLMFAFTLRRLHLRRGLLRVEGLRPEGPRQLPRLQAPLLGESHAQVEAGGKRREAEVNEAARLVHFRLSPFTPNFF